MDTTRVSNNNKPINKLKQICKRFLLAHSAYVCVCVMSYESNVFFSSVFHSVVNKFAKQKHFRTCNINPKSVKTNRSNRQLLNSSSLSPSSALTTTAVRRRRNIHFLVAFWDQLNSSHVASSQVQGLLECVFLRVENFVYFVSCHWHVACIFQRILKRIFAVVQRPIEFQLLRQLVRLLHVSQVD